MTEPEQSIEMPRHIAIIPDGNRRWAKLHGLKPQEGHKEGYEVFKRVAEAAFKSGVEFVSFYTFSTENWARSQDEVSYLMRLVAWVVTEEAQTYHLKGIRIRVVGARDRLDKKLANSLDEVEKLTEHNTAGTVCLMFNYGGRDDIIRAVNHMLEGGVKSVDEQSFANWLSTRDIPDPDLVIRTSGEQRLSNFMTWESAYSELYFTGKLWPDFDEKELDKALADYCQRKRNFGK
jgi:undecaprenyl diphosphate synthase